MEILRHWSSCIELHTITPFLESESKWRHEAIDRLWKERKSMGHTPLIKFQEAMTSCNMRTEIEVLCKKCNRLPLYADVLGNALEDSVSPVRRTFLEMKGLPNTDIFFKDETVSKTRTLKHRFAWALVLWAVVEGKVHSNSTVYDSTSGNTGASEAYMCSLIGLPYIAVVDVSMRNYHAQEEARKNQGFFINQFGNAAESEELHESGDYIYESTNMYHEIVEDLKKDNAQKKKYPDYFVHSSGTGGPTNRIAWFLTFKTSQLLGHIPAHLTNTQMFLNRLRNANPNNAPMCLSFRRSPLGSFSGTYIISGGTITSVGRYTKRYNLPTRILLADSEYSLFYDYVLSNMFTNVSGTEYWIKPGVSGIGYGYNVKPVIYGDTTSLQRNVIDEVMKMPDVASAAAMHVLRERGIDGGASTGLNFLVSLYKAYQERYVLE
ncbi:hypothetical protein KIN20_024940 [Parelaphostrongylus tenuis]|uniref:Tryptophan synthase beta chain-like PALP domain-containing protein n=1 Tax=Parelaphostrongylus tenuis TaxID=148309 RepID=A0AAD5MXN6_PARTN|nr:hypothetical protein KIN20_024940 [Parelaphostrongylus tenuis]